MTSTLDDCTRKIMGDSQLLATWGVTTARVKTVEKILRTKISAIFGRVSEKPFEEAVATWSDLAPNTMRVDVLFQENQKLETLSLAEVVTVMRAWRQVVGLRNLQSNRTLVQVASRSFDQIDRRQVAHLLMSYGVTFPVTAEQVYDQILSCVCGGNISLLEFYQGLKWFQYKDLIFFGPERINCADEALKHGQFEMDDFLVQKKNVPHSKHHDKLLEKMKKSVLVMIKHLIFPMKGISIWDEWVVKDWTRLMAIVDHYKIDLTSLVPHVLDGIKYLELSGLPEETFQKRITDLLERGLGKDTEAIRAAFNARMKRVES